MQVSLRDAGLLTLIAQRGAGRKPLTLDTSASVTISYLHFPPSGQVEPFDKVSSANVVTT